MRDGHVALDPRPALEFSSAHSMHSVIAPEP